MSYLGNVLKFEAFNGKNMLKNAWDHPDQMLLGAADPFSARVWSTITGKDYKPIVDQMGGATQDTYRKADAQGLDTHDGRQVQNLAHVIAGLYAGGYGASAAGVGGAGAAGGASGAGSAGASGLSFAGGTTGAPAIGAGTSTGLATGVDMAGAGYGSTGAAVGSSGSGAGGLLTLDNASKGMTMAQQAGLLDQKQQPIQGGQVGRQGPDFSGLLSYQGQLDAQRLAEEEKRKQQQQMIVQGLLGGAYGR